jgi:TnpA family transposase
MSDIKQIRVKRKQRMSSYNLQVKTIIYLYDAAISNCVSLHESDIRIEEHYTDTAGHRSCLRPDASPGLPLRTAHPRPGDTKLYIPKGDSMYGSLKSMIGGVLNIKHVRAYWDDILRFSERIISVMGI